jgi:hypothetical protein
MLYDLTELKRDANKRYNFFSKANLANYDKACMKDIRF